MADPLDDYLSAQEQPQGPASGPLIQRAVPVNPDDAARRVQLARRFGTSPGAVGTNQPAFDQRARTADGIANVAPGSALDTFLASDPAHAEVAHDDLGVLGSIQAGFDQASAFAKRMHYNPLLAVAHGIDNVIADDSPVLGKAVTAENVRKAGADIRPANLARSVAAGTVDLGADALSLAASPLSPPTYLLNKLFGNPLGRGADAVNQYADEIGPKTTTQAGSDILSGLRSLPVSAMSIIAGLAAPEGEVAGLGVKELVGAGMGGAMTAGASYGTGKREGLSDAKAAAYGLLDGIVETGTEVAPMHFLIKDIQHGAPIATRFMHQIMSEVPGEEVATALQDFNQWAFIDQNKGKTFGDYLDERPQAALSTLIATATMVGTTNLVVGATHKALQRLAGPAAEAQTAPDAHALLTGLTQLAEASKTRERDPETFRKAIEGMADGGDASHVYVAPEHLESLAQSGVDLATAMPTAAAGIAEAKLTGRDVEIPAGEFLSAAGAQPEIGAALLDHAKLDPNQMTKAEADSFMQSDHAQALQAEVARVLGVSDAEGAHAASRGAVEQHFEDMLGRVNRFTPAVNRHYAALTGQFYSVLGARLGLSPEEALAKYPLTVQGQSLTGDGLEQSAPSLTPAVRVNGKVYRGTDHLDALSKIADLKARNRATFDGDNRGFITERGRFVDRRVAADHARNFGLYRSDAPTWVHASSEAISEWLREPSLAQGPVDGTGGSDGTGNSTSDGPGAPVGADGAGPEARGLSAGSTGDGRGLRGGAGLLAQPPGADTGGSGPRGSTAPVGPDRLAGSPDTARTTAGRVAVEGSVVARQAAADYVDRHGLTYAPAATYAAVDVERAGRIADAFAAMPHDPRDPEVAAAYTAMASETLAQYQAVKATGLKIEFITGDNPYGMPADVHADVRDNNPLWVFATDDGFGSTAITDADVADNPLLALTDETISGRPARLNDIFRVTHDYFGHIKDGHGFGPTGEENAWQSHVAMYSPLAARAMTTETRGQNSWVNYGPVGDANRADPVNTTYAEQKIGLLPEWVSSEGRVAPIESGLPSDAGSFAQSPIFYSGLERAVDTAKLTKAPAAQWLATLAKTPGVKKEELDWTGLPDWLNAQAGSVPREDVLAFVRNKGVQIKEIFKSQDDSIAENSDDYEGRDREDDEEYGWSRVEADDPFAPQWERYVTNPEMGDSYFELLLTLPEGIAGNPKASPGSSHWSEPGVVAHVRADRRVGPGGEDVLMIHEIQSDWHQAGAKRGYNTPLDPAVRADLEAQLDAARQQIAALEAQPENAEWKARFDAASLAWNVAHDARIEARDLGDKATYDAAFEHERQLAYARNDIEAEKPNRLAIYELRNEVASIGTKLANTSGVADAPFKGMGYAQLAMKRIIRFAVDNGYDQVAWIRGEQQNGADDAEGGWFYDRNLINITNDIIKKSGGKVAKIDDINGMEPKNTGPRYDETAARAALDQARADLAALPADATAAQRDLAEREVADHQWTVDQAIKQAGPQPTGHMGFDITPALREAAQGGFAMFQSNRGAFTPSSTTISLLEKADLSTFLHELGHFFLDTYTKVATEGGAPQDITNDVNALLKYMGVKDLATWNGMSLEQQRDGHEKVARSFEAYLFSGKSPAIELNSLFSTMRAWLVQVYKQIKALGVSPSPEVRGVFDRMVATAGQIADAEASRSMLPIFADVAASGMTPDQWKAYQAQGLAASQAAVTELEARSLKDMQWLTGARSRALRNLQREAAAKRGEVRRAVTAEVMAEPVNRAREFLRRGTIDGTEVKGGFKLSIPEVDALLEGNPASKSIKDALGYGRYGMLGTENGVHPEQVAETFGFSSGDELIRALAGSEDPKAKIEGMTDQRMLEDYGDLADPTSIAHAADQAVHNEARGRFVATELNALNRAMGKAPTLAAAARQFAAQTIAGLKVRDLKPGRYTAAEVRAAKASMEALAKGNLVAAAAEKRNQLVNLYAAKAAMEAGGEIDKALRYFAKFDREGTRKALDPDYRDQIDGLLERFDLRTGVSLKALAKRASLAAWVENQREQGLDPVVPQSLLDDANKTHFKDLTVEEVRGLVDTIKNIEHLARLKTRLLTAKRERDFQKAVDTAENTIRDNAAGEVKTAIESNQWVDGVKRGVAGFFAIHRKFASLMRTLGGFVDGGPLWDTFVRPMNDAGDKESHMRHQATTALHDIFKPIVDAGGLRKKLFIPEINNSLSLEGRLAVALNWGNETNRLRIVEGDRWNNAQVTAILHTLTPEHWQFVQKLWDHIDSYWPQVAAKERRVSGVVPEKVERSPFEVTASDGSRVSMQGGYYPIAYDPLRSTKAESDNAAEVARQALLGSYTRATTRRGHTQARVESVKRAVRKDLGVVFGHVNQVIHDLSWHEYLIDATRLLRAGQIDSAIRDHYGAHVLRALKDAVQDMAGGDVGAANSFERAVTYLRTGATVAGLGWNLTTALIQPLGVVNAVRTIGPKWVGKGIMKFAGDALTMKKSTQWVVDRSPLMAERRRTQMREIAEIRNKVKTDMGRAGQALGAVEDSFFYFIGKAQLLADYPTWIGAYEKHMASPSNRDANGNPDESRAAALADQAVVDTHGGGQIKDLSAIQRGGPLMKLWTNFYSYMNVIHNNLAEDVGELRLKGPKHLPYFLADVSFVLFVPLVLEYALRTALGSSGGGDPDDDWETTVKNLAKNGLGNLLGSMVGLREIASMLQMDGRYDGLSGMRFLTATAKLMKQTEQGEADEAFWKAANNVAGVVLHYPAGQVQKTVLGYQALADGTTHNPLALLTGPPPKAKAAR